jgi:hypothetical protein
MGGINSATNIADTRTWTSLPKEFQYARLATPESRELTLDAGGVQKTVALAPGAVNVVYVKVGVTHRAAARLLLRPQVNENSLPPPPRRSPRGHGPGAAFRRLPEREHLRKRRVPAAPTYVADKRVITDNTLAGTFRVVSINQATVSGNLLKIQATVENLKNKARTLNYKFEWVDETAWPSIRPTRPGRP